MKKTVFSKRSEQKELLDTMDVAIKDLHQNLQEFKLLNRYFGSRNTIINSLETIYAAINFADINRSITIADIGCGAGDLTWQIYQWAKTKNHNIQVIGIDINPKIIEFARNNTPESADLEYRVLDVNSTTFNNYHFDIICLNNISHHFDADELILLLENLYQTASIAVVINDLKRSVVSYYAIKLLTKLLNFSYLARHDGPLSVLRAFKRQELVSTIEAIKPYKYEIHSNWLYRWQVILWKKLTI